MQQFFLLLDGPELLERAEQHILHKVPVGAAIYGPMIGIAATEL